MTDKAGIRRMATICLCGCLIGVLIAVGACLVSVRSFTDYRVALGVGIGLLLAAVIGYAVMKKRRGVLCFLCAALGNLGTGVVISAHGIYAGFHHGAAALLGQALIPAAVFAAVYLLILLVPRIHLAGKITAIVLSIAGIVIFAVLWTKYGAADCSFPLYMAVFTLFYALAFALDAGGERLGGDMLFMASIGAFVVILLIVLAVTSAGECLDGCDCGDCFSGKRKKGAK